MSVAVEVNRAHIAMPGYWRRIRNVVRIHVANPIPTLVVPWLIFAAVFALNLAIWIAIASAAGGRDQLDPDAFANNGAISWIYVFLMVAATQAMSLTFAFALGLGLTRRDYFVGTALYLSGLAVFYATGMTVLAAIESATDGWGLEGYVFAPLFMKDLSTIQQFAVHVLIALFFFATGLFTGALWVRWRAMGLYFFFGVLAFGIASLIIVVSLLDRWTSVGAFFTDQSPVVIVAWTLPWSLIVGACAYLVLRRATPR